MTRVLLTSFEPFDGFACNSSHEVARLLAGEQEGNPDFRWFVVPVVAWLCAQRVWEQVESFCPDFLLCLGQATGAKAIRIEEVGTNLNDFSIPDNAGNLLQRTPIVPGGPGHYPTTFAAAEIHGLLQAEQIPVERSRSAGTYVCNHLLYTLLHRACTERKDLRIGFLHLPVLPEQARVKTPKRKPLPSLPLDILVEATRRTIALCTPSPRSAGAPSSPSCVTLPAHL
jgi:pyroglutamyl-peptidase